MLWTVPKEGQKVFLFVPLFGMNSFFTLSPHCPGPLLSAVCDGYGFLAAESEGQDFGQLRQWALSLAASFAWIECLQLSLGQGHSSEDRNKATITKIWISRKKISSLPAAWGFG